MLPYESWEHFTRWHLSRVWPLVCYCFSAAQMVTSGAISWALQTLSSCCSSRKHLLMDSVKGACFYFVQAKLLERLFFLKWGGLCVLWKQSIEVLMSTLNCREENHVRLFSGHRVNWRKYELSVNTVVIAAWPNDYDSYLQWWPKYSTKGTMFYLFGQ